MREKTREYYFRHKEIAAYWRPLDERSELVGEFRLWHLLSAATRGCLGDVFDGEDDEGRALYSELHVFDDTPHTGTGKMAAVRATPGASDPEIWFHDLRDGALRMDLDHYADLAARLRERT